MEFVKCEAEGAVAVITIDRPKALNALNSAVLDELSATFDAIDQNVIRAIVLTGAGDKSFVAGADIGEMSTLSKEEGEVFGKKGNDVFRKIETFPIPVIAAVNGFALGGGNELAMSCDIRICAENAIFGQPEVGLGITPGFGGTQRLARLVEADHLHGPQHQGGRSVPHRPCERGLSAGRAARPGEEDGGRHREERADRCQRMQEGNQRRPGSEHG